MLLYAWTVPERVYRNPFCKLLMVIASRKKEQGRETYFFNWLPFDLHEFFSMFSYDLFSKKQINLKNSRLSVASNRTQLKLTWACERKLKALVAQSWPTLCDPMDCSPPGSSVHGISQTGILKWFAIFQGWNLGPLHFRQILLPSEPQGSSLKVNTNILHKVTYMDLCALLWVT